MMRLDSALMILGSVALSAASQIVLKYGMTTKDMKSAIEAGGVAEIALAIVMSPYIIFGFACFGVSLLIWLFILSHVPLSSAYPFVALGIVITVLASFVFFGEPMSVAKALGVVLIVSGVIIVGVGA